MKNLNKNQEDNKTPVEEKGLQCMKLDEAILLIGDQKHDAENNAENNAGAAENVRDVREVTEHRAEVRIESQACLATRGARWWTAFRIWCCHFELPSEETLAEQWRKYYDIDYAKCNIWRNILRSLSECPISFSLSSGIRARQAKAYRTREQEGQSLRHLETKCA